MKLKKKKNATLILLARAEEQVAQGAFFHQNQDQPGFLVSATFEKNVPVLVFLYQFSEDRCSSICTVTSIFIKLKLSAHSFRVCNLIGLGM